MFTLNSSSFSCLTPDDVYQKVDLYLELGNNSISDLRASGIDVTVKPPTCGHYKNCDGIVIRFNKPIYQSMFEDLVTELNALSESAEECRLQDLYEEAVECIRTAVQNSDMAQSEVGEKSRYPGLWELAEARTLTLEQLYVIIKAHGWGESHQPISISMECLMPNFTTEELRVAAMHEWTAEVCYINAKELLEQLGGSITFVPNKNRAIGSDYHGWFKIMIPESVVSKFKIDHRYPGSFMLND